MSFHEIQNYLSTTSPITNKPTNSNIPFKQIHNSIDIKLDLMSNHHKNYSSPKMKKNGKRLLSEMDSKSSELPLEEYSHLKANSIIYNIPELSPPQINFQVSNMVRSRINEIKSDIVTKFPNIKSSQYNCNKLENTFSRRTILKDLQDWLQEKLKNPPLTQEDSIEYKNMIMGIGMKEVIRLIATRCNQEANIVNQIWQLTWSICRQIILYLSKRAHRCQKILEEEATFFRNGCQQKLKDHQQKIKLLEEEKTTYKTRAENLAKDLSKLRKKNKQLRLLTLNFQDINTDLRQQFEVTFKQNLLLHLKYEKNNTNYKKLAKYKFLTMADCSTEKDFKQFMNKMMKQTNMNSDNSQIGNLQLAMDINKFKQEEDARRLQIQEELLNIFKTLQEETQTETIKQSNVNMQTQIKQFHEIGLSTETKELQETQVNTDEIAIVDNSLKLKEKKDKKPKKQVKNNKKTKSKRNQKVQIDCDDLKQPQNQEEEQNEDHYHHKQEAKSLENDNQSILHSQKLDNSEKTNQYIHHQVETGTAQDEQQPVDKKINPDRQSIQLNQKQQTNYDGKAKSQKQINIQKQSNPVDVVITSSSKPVQVESPRIASTLDQVHKEQKETKKIYQRNFMKINMGIIKKEMLSNTNDIDESCNTLINSGRNTENPNKNNNSEVQEKQKQIQQLLTMISETEKKKENQMQTLRCQLRNKNNILTSLCLQLKQLKEKQGRHQPNKLEKQNSEQVENKKQEKQKENICITENTQAKHLINLLMDNNYEQLLNILIEKVGCSENILTKNYLENELEQSTTIDEQSDAHLGKKLFSSKIRKSKQLKRLLVKNKTNKVGTQQTIGQTEQEQLQQQSKQGILRRMIKKQKRQSKRPSNMNLYQFWVRRKKNYEEMNKPEKILSFTSLCCKYFSEGLQFEIAKITKINGLTENSKRNIREQYKEVYKYVAEAHYGDKSDKQMKVLIDKAINSLLKELCKEVITAQKQGLQRIDEVKHSFSTLPILMLNRFNRNFGVRKVASKNIRDLLLSLKVIKKYTDKYSIISYFMLSSNSLTNNNLIMEYQDTQLFFFYVLLVTLFDGKLSDLEVGEEQVLSISMVAKKHLTSDFGFIDSLAHLPDIMVNQKNCNFINFYTKFIHLYKDLYTQRTNQLQFIYYYLPKQLKDGKEGIMFEDFLEFLSIFHIKRLSSTNQNYQETEKNSTWMSTVIKCIGRVLREEKVSQKGIITYECYIKFIVKCPQFNISVLRQYLDSFIGEQQFNIGDEISQNHLLAICNQHELLYQIGNYLTSEQNLKQQETSFWVKFIKLYTLQKQVDNMMGNLLLGVLDPRTRPILLRG